MTTYNLYKIQNKISELTDQLNKKVEANKSLKSMLELELKNKELMQNRNVAMQKSIAKAEVSAENLRKEIKQLSVCSGHFENEVKVGNEMLRTSKNKITELTLKNKQINELNVDTHQAIAGRKESIESLEGIKAILEFEIELKEQFVQEYKESNRLIFDFNKVHTLINDLVIKKVKTLLTLVTRNFVKAN